MGTFWPLLILRIDMSLISLKNISKVYNVGKDIAVTALDAIDLEIENGEFVAIMGPSGSGKSTLMHVIGFLDRPTSGTYLFKEKNVTNLSDVELATIRNEDVGFVFQSFNLLPRTTAVDNVALPMLYAAKHSNAEMQAQALKFLKLVGLSDRAMHQPSELSGGQQQRVAIARALINNPAVIFADEPTGNLDSKSTVEIMDLFSNLNQQGHTLIFVTHEENVANCAKRVVRLEDGKIISDKRKA